MLGGRGQTSRPQVRELLGFDRHLWIGSRTNKQRYPNHQVWDPFKQWVESFRPSFDRSTCRLHINLHPSVMALITYHSPPDNELIAAIILISYLFSLLLPSTLTSSALRCRRTTGPHSSVMFAFCSSYNSDPVSCPGLSEDFMFGLLLQTSKGDGRLYTSLQTVFDYYPTLSDAMSHHTSPSQSAYRNLPRPRHFLQQ